MSVKRCFCPAVGRVTTDVLCLQKPVVSLGRNADPEGLPDFLSVAFGPTYITKVSILTFARIGGFQRI